MQPGQRLAAQDVSKRFGSHVALDAVSLVVNAGECVALVGESGSGKTTLLRLFNALVRPDSGRVLIDGEEVAEADGVALRRRMGYVPQEGGLLPHWRVQRNVELVPWLRDVAVNERAEAARKALILAGLDPARFAERWPSELSGGQRQRVAIARALAARPDVVLLDEPFGALDAITRGELHVAFGELRAELGITALLVTHDVREAMLLADRVVVLRAGRIEQDAAPAELLRKPATDYVSQLLATAGVTG